MFRRSPLLGAAVVIGASRSAARREVSKQELMQEERNAEIQRSNEEVRREAERKRYEEEEQKRRTQLAIDEAIAKERARTEQQARAAVQPNPNISGHLDVPVNRQAGDRYCVECGLACKREDKFCSRCGAKQPQPPPYEGQKMQE